MEWISMICCPKLESLVATRSFCYGWSVYRLVFPAASVPSISCSWLTFLITGVWCRSWWAIPWRCAKSWLYLMTWVFSENGLQKTYSAKKLKISCLILKVVRFVQQKLLQSEPHVNQLKIHWEIGLFLGKKLVYSFGKFPSCHSQIDQLKYWICCQTQELIPPCRAHTLSESWSHVHSVMWKSCVLTVVIILN